MPKLAEDLQKHTLNLYRGDYDRLRQLYPEIGAGLVIRRLVHQYVIQCEANALSRPKDLPEINL